MSDLQKAEPKVDADTVFEVNHVNGVDVKYASWTENSSSRNAKHTLIINPASEFSDLQGLLLITELDPMGKPSCVRIDAMNRKGTLIERDVMDKYKLLGLISGGAPYAKTYEVIKQETGIQAIGGQCLMHALQELGGNGLDDAERVKEQMQGLIDLGKETDIISPDKLISDAVVQTVFESDHIQRSFKDIGMSQVATDQAKPITDQSR